MCPTAKTRFYNNRAFTHKTAPGAKHTCIILSRTRLAVVVFSQVRFQRFDILWQNILIIPVIPECLIKELGLDICGSLHALIGVAMSRLLNIILPLVFGLDNGNALFSCRKNCVWLCACSRFCLRQAALYDSRSRSAD